MSWSFKFVGNYTGIEEALLKSGGQFDGEKLVTPDSYKVARDVILTQLCQQTQAPEIGWQVEAWGGGLTLCLHTVLSRSQRPRKSVLARNEKRKGTNVYNSLCFCGLGSPGED